MNTLYKQDWHKTMLRNLTCFVVFAVCPIVSADDESGRLEFAIAIHGGAGSLGNLSAEQREKRLDSLRQSLTIGRDILKDGGTSLNAVEHVIRFLEDDPQFNAGKGAVFNSEGGHELDASIMDGRNRACGAVAGVKTVKNPISLARLVMTETRHVLLAADGADRFAQEMKAETVDQEYFWTESKHKAWLEVREKQERKKDEKSTSRNYKGTVGCVALDKHGNLAAGTSTGGLTNKKYGRVGDSPIVGAGTYADNKTCAISCTGIGEHFIRNAVAYDVSARMAYKGESIKEAVSHVIHETLKPGFGGIIGVAHNGSIWVDFNTAGMARGAADSSGRFEVHLGPKEKPSP
jgi:beta-aspartyl-peptidase (threonine type)